MTRTRSDLSSEFLSKIGWGGADRVPITGDASFRRYERLNLSGRNALLMDAPPSHESVAAFAQVGRYLCREGFSAPQIFDADEKNGFLLLEDLGDDTYTRLLKQGADEPSLYQSAVDVLVALQQRPLPEALPAYDEQVLHKEAGLFIDWYLPAVTGTTIDSEISDSYYSAWSAIFPAVLSSQRVVVLRDYHADNLMWLPNREGMAAVGLLDFQDALAGDPAYDLVSLLEDARRDVPGALAEAMIARYLKGVGAIDPDLFSARYAILGAQRNAKIIGIFTRLWKRDGKPQYLPLIPRVWAHLQNDLTHSALRPVKDWMDRHVPPDLRQAPEVLP